jgi:N-acetylglucosamine kinase-like BadF-type ATPase
MSIAVGVDAGGTSTVAVASRDGVTGEPFAAEAGNASSRGLGAALEAMTRAIDGALAGDRPNAIAVGAAGAGRESIAREMHDALSARYAGAHVSVADDARIALRAGAPAGDGIVLIAGTGSIAYAEIGTQTYRAGGHGYAIDDGGSGFAIGAAAARLLVRSYDGRVPKDATTDAIARALGATDALQVLDRIYREGPPVATIASLAREVIRLADAGERSAVKIVQGAALELGDLVRAVAKASGSIERELPIVFAGGMLQTNSLLTFLLETRVANELPSMHVVKNAPDPCYGALALAEGTLV